MGSEHLSSARMDWEWKSAELLGREEEEVVKEQALEKHTEAATALQPSQNKHCETPTGWWKC